MGFKIFSKRNGKRTVNDKPENSDTKVTEASERLPNSDPEAAKYSPKEPMNFERNQNPELLKCQFLFVSTEQELSILASVS